MLDQALRDKVLAQVNRQELIDLASQLVAIPSFKTQETPIAEFLAPWFRERGYDVQLQEVEPGRFQCLAWLRGSGAGQSVMLNGHCDIDPIPLGQQHDPWKAVVEGDRMYGGGIHNMKAGLTAMVMAAEALRRSGVERRGDVLVAAVVGELQLGVGTLHLLKSGVRTDHAIVAEPFGAHCAVTAHCGVAEMAINILGRSAHISRKEEGVDAIAQMTRVWQALQEVEWTCTRRDDMPHLPRLLVGCVIGGSGREHDMLGPNFVSDYVTMLVDVRFLPGQTGESVVADVDRQLKKLQVEDPELVYEIECPPPARWNVGRAVFNAWEVPVTLDIVQAVVSNYRAVTGNEPQLVGVRIPHSYAGNDTAHLWEAGIPCVLYGPCGGRGARGEPPDQWMSIDEMELSCKVAACAALEMINRSS